MKDHGIYIHNLPKLKRPILIAGFDGWGNALNVSKGLADYFILKFNAKYIAEFEADMFFRFDESRPIVDIEEGKLKNISPPAGLFYAAKTGLQYRDLVILTTAEPSIQWFYFVELLLDFCIKLEIRTIITIGSMYDNVVHTDRIISGMTSDDQIFLKFVNEGVIPINYHGQGSIHSLIQSEAQKKGFQCSSLWCHCPYYLEELTHFGMIAFMADLVSSIAEFDLDTTDLDAHKQELDEKIQTMIENDPTISEIIREIRKEKVKGAWENIQNSSESGKVISLRDFLDRDNDDFE